MPEPEKQVFHVYILLVHIHITGNKRNKATLAFTVLVLVQLSLVIGLLILGLKGKDETDIGNDGGVPYYTGALLVASVVIVYPPYCAVSGLCCLIDFFFLGNISVRT